MKNYALMRYYVFDNNTVAALQLSLHEDETEARHLARDMEQAIKQLSECVMVHMEGGNKGQSSGLTAGAHVRALGIKKITHDVMAIDLYSPVKKAESKIIMPH